MSERSLFVLTYASISVDLITDAVSVGGREVPGLGSIPCRLLKVLLSRPGETVSWSELDECVFRARLSRTGRDSHLWRLRRSLGEKGHLIVREKLGVHLAVEPFTELRFGASGASGIPLARAEVGR
jgi:DNA-binding response OmpR family regulator